MGKIYVYRDKTAGKYPHDDTYTIEGDVRMKSPESGKWYDAVLYKSTTNGKMFCRERDDFEDKFVEKIDKNECHMNLYRLKRFVPFWAGISEPLDDYVPPGYLGFLDDM